MEHTGSAEERSNHAGRNGFPRVTPHAVVL